MVNEPAANVPSSIQPVYSLWPPFMVPPTILPSHSNADQEIGEAVSLNNKYSIDTHWSGVWLGVGVTGGVALFVGVCVGVKPIVGVGEGVILGVGVYVGVGEGEGTGVSCTTIIGASVSQSQSV